MRLRLLPPHPETKPPSRSGGAMCGPLPGLLAFLGMHMAHCPVWFPAGMLQGVPWPLDLAPGRCYPSTRSRLWAGQPPLFPSMFPSTRPRGLGPMRKSGSPQRPRPRPSFHTSLRPPQPRSSDCSRSPQLRRRTRRRLRRRLNGSKHRRCRRSSGTRLRIVRNRTSTQGPRS